MYDFIILRAIAVGGWTSNGVPRPLHLLGSKQSWDHSAYQMKSKLEDLEILEVNRLIFEIELSRGVLLAKSNP